jgi:hypothetical protein
VIVGDSKDGAGLPVVAHRGVAGADAEIGGRDRHRRRRLPQVVLIDVLGAIVGRFGDNQRNGSRCRCDMPRALPHRRKFLELNAVSHDHKVPVLAVWGRRRSPPRLCDAVQIAAGGVHQCNVMVDHDNRVSIADQAAHDGSEGVDVGRVQSYGGLVLHGLFCSAPLMIVGGHRVVLAREGRGCSRCPPDGCRETADLDRR